MPEEKKQKQIELGELVVEETRLVDPGNYTGKITGVYGTESEYDGEIVRYLNVDINVNVSDEETATLTAGYPLNLKPHTMLGKLLKRFGMDVSEPGSTVDPNELEGEECQFSVVEEETPNGIFSRITRESLQPLK